MAHLTIVKQLELTLPALNAVMAPFVPLGASVVLTYDYQPELKITMPMPETNAATLEWSLAYGGTVRKVEASGWSWKNTTADNLSETSRRMAALAVCMRILESIT